ncbi:phage scaffolding protein [Paenibacillus sp. FSL R10-2734]|uniref:phage scaffolding protein n=1 Tax=Paenibacillus sp. FSL R10-2734 TaxID=2954691 RepID=UPI0030D85E7C
MDLKELLGEELFNKVFEKAGDKHKIALVSDGSWIPKDKFNEVNTAKKTAEDTLKDRDKQLEDLKKSAGDNASLQEKITKLQDENKTAADKYSSDLSELKMSTAIKMALTGDAHDPDIVAGLLDKSQIQLDENGSIKGGLDDLLKPLRESKGFLFAEKQESKPPAFRGTTPSDSKPSGGGGQQPENFGKLLADQRNAGGKDLEKARESYFN